MSIIFNYLDKRINHHTVGNCVWIDVGIKMIEGAHIGDGAIVGGVTAKNSKCLFDDATNQKIIALKWWDKDTKWLRKHT